MAYKLQLTNFQNIAPGNVATLKVPAGPNTPTYDQIKLVLGGGLTPAHIEWLRLKANGRIVIDEGTGTVLNLRDAYRGVFTEAGFVVMDFTEPKARNGAAEQLLASIPGNLLQDLTLEVKLAAGAPGAGTLLAWANYRPPTSNPFILKRLQTVQSFAAAGTEAAPQIMYLPVGQAGGKVKRLWLHESVAGTTSRVEIRIANNVVHTITRAGAENDQKRNGLTPQAGIFVVDFVEDGNLSGVLDTAQAPTVELRIVNGAACTYTVYSEFIDPIARL